MFSCHIFTFLPYLLTPTVGGRPHTWGFLSVAIAR